MNRRFALVALWAVFAAAAVGVGFGAAGLVGDPFTDRTVDSSFDATPSRSAPTDTTSPDSSPRPQPSGTRESSATRTITTRGGLVSATCRSGLAQVSAAPAVGWQIDELESGHDEEGKVRFERGDDGEARVEVKVACSEGTPRFSLEDDASGRGGEDGGED